MPKPIIAIDMDDVISSQVDLLIEFGNKRYGMQWTRDDFKAPGEYWDYYEHVWKVGQAEGARRFQEFLDEGYPYLQSVEPDVVAALKQLKKSYRLVVATSRGADFADGTIKLIQTTAPGIFDDVHFVYTWDRPDAKATKAQLCLDIGAEYLIDDNFEHCSAAAEVGIQALLFGELGWNAGRELSANITRVKDWPEVLEYFDDVSDLVAVEKRKHESTGDFNELVKEFKQKGLL